MQITKNTVVEFFYTLKDEQGEILESNFESDPIVYLHGHDNMMLGLEKALDAKEAGSEFTVTPDPKDTYGEVITGDAAQMRVSVKHLQGAKVWKAGMSALIQTEQGPRQVTVVKVGKFMATIDINHPLAGKELSFDLKVASVREASEEEIAHGHVHGPGGVEH
ncbi:peptidylprolyl isomerase [Paraferrimonas sp. SM1919]|uniref:FKBP-type peptidyl-prolyl cis-trans isomerase n=1 Tax=Paraferrimonas sp. SM1919 TaxID=2662263 RepID=UPI0013D566F3|nr:peptidylprolyl isomerase [Paraferrimonas sp. SM1919]